MKLPSEIAIAPSLDYSALQSPVSAAEHVEFAKKYHGYDEVADLSSRAKVKKIGLILGPACLVAFALAFVFAGQLSEIIISILALVSFTGFLVALVMVWYGFYQPGKEYVSSIRLSRFAAANGWTYERQNKDYRHPGMFSQIEWYDQVVFDRISPSKDAELPPFEVGTFGYSTGLGQPINEHWAYCCIELDRNLPNIVLDAHTNNDSSFGTTLSNLPAYYFGKQTIRLEGNFNEYFTLYAPEKYKRDALYIFTPDVMSVFIDGASSLDAEIVDNKLFLYEHLPFGTKSVNPRQLYRFLQAFDLIAAKLDRQTDYYADDRAGSRAANTVATPGKRLEQRYENPVDLAKQIVSAKNLKTGWKYFKYLFLYPVGFFLGIMLVAFITLLIRRIIKGGSPL